MANLHDCLQRAAEAGDLDPARAEQALGEYDQLVDRYSKAMPIHQAQAKAAEDLKEATRRAARSRRHAVLNQLQAMVRLKHLIETSPDPARAVRNLVEWSEGSGFKGESIHKLVESYTGSVNGEMNKVLRAVGHDILGRSRNQGLLTDLIDELHLTDTGNAEARGLAEIVRGQQKRLRQLFNAHGGDIGELADYGLRHSHDVGRIRSRTFKTWSEHIIGKLDWSRIENHKTGKPFAETARDVPSPETVEPFLEDVYNSIVTRGWDTKDPSMNTAGKALYNRRSDHRVLHFKSGRDWLDYNKEFGLSDPFSAMIGGLHGMVRDIAQMRVLGPNPTRGLEYAIQVATKRAHLSPDPKLAGRVEKAGAISRVMLGEVSGANSQTAYVAMSAFFAGTRKVLTSTQLGSAALSSMTDLATISMAAQAVGMNPGNVLSRMVKLMASHATRETAARMGYVAETLAQAGAVSARWTGDTIAPELAERFAGFTIRASGLSFWTDMARMAFRMEFNAHLAENAGRALDAVEDPLREILISRGITPADWDALRAPETLFTAPNGATFLSPHYWRHTTPLGAMEAEGLSMRLQMVIDEQLEFAVPSTSLEARSALLDKTDPGSIGGILLRSTTQYKNYPMTLTLNMYRRFMAIDGAWNKAKFAAGLSVPLLLIGALVMQSKQISKGRDPQPMDTGKFWMAAMLQGGGLGIFGDFFFSETSRAGGGLTETVAGPVVGLGGDLIRPVASNIQRAIEGKNTSIGRDTANFVRYNTPVASSLWYTRLAYDRLVADTLQRFLDPEAETQWRQQERRLRREYGTATFWPRGAATPERAPDLSNVFGGDE